MLGISRPQRCAIARTSRMRFSTTRWSPLRATLSSIGAADVFRFTRRTGCEMPVSWSRKYRLLQPSRLRRLHTPDRYGRQLVLKLVLELLDAVIPELHQFRAQCANYSEDDQLIFVLTAASDSTTHGSTLPSDVCNAGVVRRGKRDDTSSR